MWGVKPCLGYVRYILYNFRKIEVAVLGKCHGISSYVCN